MKTLLAHKNVTAWVLLMLSLAIHVMDEALTDFLPFYNQVVHGMEERLGFFPAPAFTFGLWLGGLIAAIIIGLSLTPLVKRGGRIIRILTTTLGGIMILNALGHMLGSVYLGRLLPGFWSSPLLIVTAIFVVERGINGRWGDISSQE